MSDINPRARHRARIIAMQGLYQWQLSGNAVSEIVAESRIANAHFKTDWPFCETLLLGVGAEHERLDAAITPHLLDPLTKTNPVELAILRLGAYELTCCPETPYPVILSQYVDIAMEFGADQGEKFVNGVLESIAKKSRPFEFKVKV